MIHPLLDDGQIRSVGVQGISPVHKEGNRLKAPRVRVGDGVRDGENGSRSRIESRNETNKWRNR